MGVAASAASPSREADAPTDPPAKEDIQPAATAEAPPEAAAPTDSPAKDSPVKDEFEPPAAGTAGGDADAAGETGVSDAGEEEEEDCPFCVYMKGGGCKEEFVEWEKCVDEADADGSDDIVKQCGKLVAALHTCMDNHPDYYVPNLCRVDPQFWPEDLRKMLEESH